MYEIQYRNKAGIRSMFFPAYSQSEVKKLVCIMKGTLGDKNVKLHIINSKSNRNALNDDSIYKN